METMGNEKQMTPDETAEFVSSLDVSGETRQNVARIIRQAPTDSVKRSYLATIDRRGKFSLPVFEAFLRAECPQLSKPDEVRRPVPAGDVHTSDCRCGGSGWLFGESFMHSGYEYDFVTRCGSE